MNHIRKHQFEIENIVMLQFLKKVFGGEGGIRTHGTLARTPVFKTGTFNHSVTSPEAQRLIMPRECDIQRIIARGKFTKLTL